MHVIKVVALVLVQLSILLSAPTVFGAEAQDRTRRGVQHQSSMLAVGVEAVERRVIDFGEHGLVVADAIYESPSVWEGSAVGDVAGTVMVVQTSVGEVFIVQRTDGSTMQSLPLGGGRRVVHVADRLPPCGGVAEGVVAQTSGSPSEGELAGGCDDGSVIDVLVKWTPSAESQAGGATAIRALAESAMAMANHGYLASGIDLHLRGVGLSVTEPYSGDASSSVLDQLAATNDGNLDSVHAERNALGADLVALLTGENPAYCGVAFIAGNDPGKAFAVCVWSCVSNQTFAHEVGHNEGCCHAPGDGGGCQNGGLFSYSLGHRFTGNNGTQYRTIMAYEPGARIARFSSPLIQYLGTPTGLTTRDNARTIRQTKSTLANFRCSLDCESRPPQLMSPLLPVPTAGGSTGFSVPMVLPAAEGTQVELTTVAVADLSSGSKSLSLQIGSSSVGVIIAGPGGNCSERTSITSIPASAFNQAIGNGLDVAFTIRASGTIGTCASSEVSVSLRYETAVGCRGDVNADGTVDGADLGALMSGWDLGCQSAYDADLNNDGTVDSEDLGEMLSMWGPCQRSITAIFPASGTPGGGTTLTISGENLIGSSTVLVGSVPATGVQVLNDRTVRAITPPGQLGQTSVSVGSPGNLVTLQNAFTYTTLTVPAWATLIEGLPDPAVVTNPSLRAAIISTGLAWRVRDTASNIEMLLIPPGTFAMGCTASTQTACANFENPVHGVTLTQPFYLGRFEVTQQQWQDRMGYNPSSFQAASLEVPLALVSQRPVEQVSWNAIAGVGGFLQVTNMRFPTEAEWEYACRAGTVTAFHGAPALPNGTTSESDLTVLGWHSVNAALQTRPVGSRSGNGLGLHDMSGNVYEWVSDWWGTAYYGSSPSQNPTGPASGTNRVVRGGCWSVSAGSCRSSSRGNSSPANGNNLIGFRVARNP
jgi:formylglycine-generating enzyme required for sulfatase activity